MDHFLPQVTGYFKLLSHFLESNLTENYRYQQTCGHQLRDEVDLGLRRNGRLLILEAIARPNLNDSDLLRKRRLG